MKRTLIVVATLAVVLGVVSMAMPTPAAARQGVTITVWATGSENEALVMQAAADLWAEQTGNTVDVQAVSWDDAHAKILTAATSGEGPDIMTGGLSYGIEFGELGGMVNLGEKYPDDIAAMKAAANPAIWKATESMGGEVYAVPYDLTIFLQYARPDLLAELGLEVPTTWEELVAVSDAVLATNGEGGAVIQWGNGQWVGYSNFLYQAGGNFYDDECNVTIDSEEAVEALEFYASLYTEHGFSQDGWPSLEPGLDSGLYPVGLTGSWVAGSLDASYPNMVGKWAVSTLPAGPSGKGTAFIGGRVMGVMSFSPNADVAYDFIKFLYTEEAAVVQIEKGAELSILYIPPQTEFQAHIAYGDAVREAIQAQLADAIAPPNCSGWEAAANEVTALIETVIYEGADAQEALDDAAFAMEELLGN